jgi:hypothetical protein
VATSEAIKRAKALDVDVIQVRSARINSCVRVLAR